MYQKAFQQPILGFCCFASDQGALVAGYCSSVGRFGHWNPFPQLGPLDGVFLHLHSQLFY